MDNWSTHQKRNVREHPFSNSLPNPKRTKACSECIRMHMSCDCVRPSCQNCLRRKKVCRYDQYNLLHPALFSRTGSPSQSRPSHRTVPLSSPPTSIETPPSSVSIVQQNDHLITRRQELIDSLEQTIQHLNSQIIDAQSYRFYQWDPDEKFLHQLICHSKTIFETSDSRKIALSQLVSMLVRFAESRPSRMMLICRVEPNTKVILS